MQARSLRGDGRSAECEGRLVTLWGGMRPVRDDISTFDYPGIC